MINMYKTTKICAIVLALMIFSSKNCKGDILASRLYDGTINIWDTSTEKIIQTLQLQSYREKIKSLSITFSPDGTILASGNDNGTINIWDTSTWENIQTLHSSFKVEITSIAFSPDGAMLASGNNKGEITIWSALSWQNKGMLKASKYNINSIAFNFNGTMLASGSEYGGVIIWNTSNNDPKNWQIKKNLEGTRDAKSIAFNHEGTILAAAFSRDNFNSEAIKIWNTSTWDEIPTSIYNVNNYISSIVFNPTGTMFAQITDHKDTIEIYDTSTWDEIQTLKHEHFINSITFNSDGKMLASGLQNGEIIIWDTSDRNPEGWKKIKTLLGKAAYSFSPGRLSIQTLAFKPSETEEERIQKENEKEDEEERIKFMQKHGMTKIKTDIRESGKTIKVPTFPFSE